MYDNSVNGNRNNGNRNNNNSNNNNNGNSNNNNDSHTSNGINGDSDNNNNTNNNNTNNNNNSNNNSTNNNNTNNNTNYHINFNMNIKRTRQFYKDNEKRKAFKIISDIGYSLHLHDICIERSKHLFSVYRDRMDIIHDFILVVAGCMILGYRDIFNNPNMRGIVFTIHPDTPTVIPTSPTSSPSSSSSSPSPSSSPSNNCNCQSDNNNNNNNNNDTINIINNINLDPFSSQQQQQQQQQEPNNNTNSSNTNPNMRTIQLNNDRLYPFHCNWCNKKFNSKMCLKIHKYDCKSKPIDNPNIITNNDNKILNSKTSSNT